MNSDNDDAVEYYLQELDSDPEKAYFGLIEMGHSIIPRLVQACRAEANPRIRKLLVEIIWHYRLPSTLDFLGEMLRDSDPEVWKMALDGIVVINGPKSIEILMAEKVRLSESRSRDSSLRLEWVEEAMGQISDV